MAGSRGFGSIAVGDEFLSVRFDAKVLIRLADRTGKSFGPGFREALAGVHERVAIKIQEAMVEELKRKVHDTGRHQRGSNYLEIALAAEGNRDWNARHFTVLRPAFMDRSPAELYWRQIEFGNTREYQGYVLFSNGGGKAYGPWREGGQRKLWGRQIEQPPGYKHSKLIMTRYGKGGWSSSIGPFPAYHYTRGGIRAMRSISMKAEYSKALSRIGIKFSDISRVK